MSTDSDFPAEPLHKTSEIKTKSGEIIFGNVDYRGIIAIIVVVAFVFALFYDKTTAMVLGPFAGVIVTWYFRERMISVNGNKS